MKMVAWRRVAAQREGFSGADEGRVLASARSTQHAASSAALSLGGTAAKFS